MNELLKDLISAGVKWELTDIPVGFSIQEPIEPQTARIRVSAIVPPISPVSTVGVETARACAARPTTLAALDRMISEFNHPLRSGVTNVVLPHIANAPNGLLIITDMPSSEDDANGQILSGPAGDLTDKMLTAIGMSRENVHIGPVLFWRTPGGRSPSRQELDLGRPFLDKLIELTEPRVILTFGTLAAAEVANIDLMHNHGNETSVCGNIPCFSVYHPNYLILKPGAKADVWVVLQNVQKLLKNL